MYKLDSVNIYLFFDVINSYENKEFNGYYYTYYLSKELMIMTKLKVGFELNDSNVVHL